MLRGLLCGLLCGLWHCQVALRVACFSGESVFCVSMRVQGFRICFTLLLTALLCLVAQAIDDLPAPMRVLPTDPTAEAGPKLLRRKTGYMKDDYQPDYQRKGADKEILENAEDNQPESERVVASVDDLSWAVTLTG